VTSAYSPDPPAATPLKVLLLAGVLVLGVLVVGPELGTFLPRTPQQEAVAVAVQRALVASQNAAVPRARDSTGAVGSDELARLHAAAHTTADELFASGYHETWVQLMDEVIDRDDVVTTVFGGGADSFSRWHIQIDGTQATVQVRARVFLEMSQTPLGPHTVAENVIDFDIRLEQIDGSWRIGMLAQTFASGGGP
jgi:hypothetical protein